MSALDAFLAAHAATRPTAADLNRREQAILAGPLSYAWAPLVYDLNNHHVELAVTADYVAFGERGAAMLIPMRGSTAQAVADADGAGLPTAYLVDRIMRSAKIRLVGVPLGHGLEMGSTAWYKRSADHIARELLTKPYVPGDLVAGHKKDVIIPVSKGRTAIYGFCRTLSALPNNPLAHRGPGYAYTWWQPATDGAHDDAWVDYSHGVRLVKDVRVDGVAYGYEEALTKFPALFFGARRAPGALRYA